MDRRRFLIHTARAGSVLLILPAGWVVGCDTSGNAGSTGPAAPADGPRFTSDVAGTHTHDFTIAMETLAQPPENGLSGPTTASLGHMHVVSLSQDELAQIEAGETINRSTSIVDGHLHNFKFSLATAQTQGTTPTMGTGSGTSSGGT